MRGLAGGQFGGRGRSGSLHGRVGRQRRKHITRRQPDCRRNQARRLVALLIVSAMLITKPGRRRVAGNGTRTRVGGNSLANQRSMRFGRSRRHHHHRALRQHEARHAGMSDQRDLHHQQAGDQPASQSAQPAPRHDRCCADAQLVPATRLNTTQLEVSNTIGIGGGRRPVRRRIGSAILVTNPSPCPCRGSFVGGPDLAQAGANQHETSCRLPPAACRQGRCCEGQHRKAQ